MGYIFWSFVGCCDIVVELKQSIVAFFLQSSFFFFAFPFVIFSAVVISKDSYI